MKALVCGSMAYDTIMVFEDDFKNHILPDQVHILNVCFFAPSMRREFGGCAGNIAYNLKMLGGEPLIMATVGDDFDSYRYQLKKHDLSDDLIKHIPGTFTAQAFITTDKSNNQITAFHPGSIPGQGLPMFSGDELKTFLEQATYAVVNDYESKMMQEKTGLSEQEIASKVQAFIVTKGGEGASIFVDGDEVVIPAAPISEAIDPTGCGDAFRGGLLYGLMNNLGWDKTGRIASLCGAIKIEKNGTQNHSFTFDEFSDRYKSSFGESL